MSQTSVTDEPGQAYAGKVHVAGMNVTRIASELVYFGKLVITAATDISIGGGTGGQEVAAPTDAAEVLLAKFAGGVSIADPSVERLRDPLNLGVANSAPFGAYAAETVLSVMRSGFIWVQTEVAVTDMSDGVFVRVASAGTIPIAALGSFTPTNTASHEPVPEGMVWAGAATVGSLEFGLLNINLPA